jgi:glycogen debranching enzyme
LGFEITVGPLQLVINQGHGFLVTDQDGHIPWPTNKGLYFFDTRMISSWQIFANGKSWELLNASNISHYAARIFLTNPSISTEQGEIQAHTLGLALGRSIDGGIHEDIDIINYGMKSVHFNLEIAIRCDFADLFEVKSRHIVRRGRITTDWCARTMQLTTAYRNKDFFREVTIGARRNDASPVYAKRILSKLMHCGFPNWLLPLGLI